MKTMLVLFNVTIAILLYMAVLGNVQSAVIRDALTLHMSYEYNNLCRDVEVL